MYFPIGWPNFYNASKQTGLKEDLICVRFNRNRGLFVTLSTRTVYLWKTKPRLVLAMWRRADDFDEQGNNTDIYWSPDSSMLVVVTDARFLLFLDLFEIQDEKVFHLNSLNSRSHIEQLDKKPIAKIELTLHSVCNIQEQITSIAPRPDELYVATATGALYKFSWTGEVQDGCSLNIQQVDFCEDLDAGTGAPLPAHEHGVFITAIECSPLLGGFAIVLSNGGGGFLTASTVDFKPEDIVGLFAKDLSGAVSIAINVKHLLICFGCENGQASAFTFDDINGGLILSHTYSLPRKDYPDAGSRSGSICQMMWTPDGCGLATIWLRGGVAVWSVFGALLMCVQTIDYGSDLLSSHDSLRIVSMDWGHEGYELLLVPDSSTSSSHDVTSGDILQLRFAKSALTVNPCMSNRQHLFLQGDNSIYLNTGDVMLQNNNGAFHDDANNHSNSNHSNTTSMHFSNKHWQTIQAPHNYITANWPIRYAAIDNGSQLIAIAGVYGYAHFSIARRKWKLFGNETQEKNVTVRGGITWWGEFLIVGCYNFEADSDEVRVHPRKENLDSAYAHCIRVSAPIFQINTFNDMLIVYCADCSVAFYKMRIGENHDVLSGLEVEKHSETSILEYLVHPINVTSLSLTSLSNEQSRVSFTEESTEAQSLIVNVAGKVLMLQKDKSSAGKNTEKVQFVSPVVLASCVENIWYMLQPTNNKQHLEESLWLACGAQGMQAWLPLFPTREGIRPLGFLSKRIMLHFELQLYPLAVLFEDAVILGIGSDESCTDDCLTPSPVIGASMPFPFFKLQRSTEVYLPQILRQLLRRNLGVHALDIARCCTGLPYFTHVLELMLHEVLEAEATASKPIPDPLLPRVVAFIQEFPQFLETICACARKTEVALWPHLFSFVGSPIELFKSCHLTGKLDTAASYLIIIQSLEDPVVSGQHATTLLEAALDSNRWELAKDLVRFLTTIENSSPPPTPTTISYAHHKPLHQHSTGTFTHQTIHAGMEEDALTEPVMVPIPRRETGCRKSATPTSANQKPGTSANQKERSSTLTNQKERSGSGGKERPPSLKLSKREVFPGTASPIKPMDASSKGESEFYIDTILYRHARKLLASYELKLLGKFAAHLKYDLISFAEKERDRSSLIDQMSTAICSIHKQFSWPFPKQLPTSGMRGSRPPTTSPTSHRPPASPLPTERIMATSSLPTSGVVTPNTSELGVSEAPTEVGSIRAMLEQVNDEMNELGCAVVSEAGSFTTIDDTHSVASESPLLRDVIPSDLTSFMNEQSVGSKQDRKELTYMLHVFARAHCLDWVVLLSLLLCDIQTVRLAFEREESLAMARSNGRNRFESLLGQIAELRTWAVQACPTYLSLLDAISLECALLSSRLSFADLHQSTHNTTDSVFEESSLSLSRTASSGELCAQLSAVNISVLQQEQVNSVADRSIVDANEVEDGDREEVEKVADGDECVIS